MDVMGIREEFIVFVLAVLSGCIIRLFYRFLSCIRWYFALGVVLGAILSSILIKKVEKLHKKIYMQRGKDFF